MGFPDVKQPIERDKVPPPRCVSLALWAYLERSGPPRAEEKLIEIALVYVIVPRILNSVARGRYQRVIFDGCAGEQGTLCIHAKFEEFRERSAAAVRLRK